MKNETVKSKRVILKLLLVHLVKSFVYGITLYVVSGALANVTEYFQTLLLVPSEKIVLLGMITYFLFSEGFELLLASISS